SHDEDCDIGGLRSTSTHGREGGVARSIDEGDLLSVLFDLIGSDVLCDTTGFTSNDIGVAECVKKRRLAVVDVTHDRHNRWSGNLLAFVIDNVEDTFFNVGFGNALDGMAKFDSDKLRKVCVDDVARLHHLTFLHQELDDINSPFGHPL